MHGKNSDGIKEERARSLVQKLRKIEHKCSHNTVKCASRTMSTSENDEYKREQQHLEKQIECVVI